MPIQPLEEWFGSRLPSLPLSALKDAVVGIDASYFLNQHLPHEPLLGALGASFVLKSNVETELSIFRSNGITPIFVFNGLDFGGARRESAWTSSSANSAFKSAWAAYDDKDIGKVLEWFTQAGTSVESLYKSLQAVLVQNKVDFIVAPYSAGAQLAYLRKSAEHFMDAVLGPVELFVFDIEKVIVRVDFEQSTFEWLERAPCQERLNRASDDLFRDALLLTGTQFLPPFPPLQRLPKTTSIRDACSMLNNAGRSVTSLCNQYRDDQEIQNLQYADRYKKAAMTIRHHVIMESDGKVAPLDMQHAPGDVHEFIGQRLPEELYFYVSKGILSPHVPNWLTSGIVDAPLPQGTAESEPYRRLLREELVPVWTQSLSLLSTSLHRYYQTRNVSVRGANAQGNEAQINLKEVPSVRDELSRWKIHEDGLPESVRGSSGSALLAVLNGLTDSSFVSRTLKKASQSEPLSSKKEIIANSLWRYLQLRDYVSSSTHELTSWGKALQAALFKLDPVDQLEDGVILCIELIRLGLVNDSEMLSHLSDGPKGTGAHKRFSNLISRVACFGHLKHTANGYSGPLSRQLQIYASLIAGLREGLRDLMEVVVAVMFLAGDVSRDREDWYDLGTSIPLSEDYGAGLAILAKTYFDILYGKNEQKPDQEPTEEQKAQSKDECSKYFHYVESFQGNLGLAFRLWDAVYAGVQAAGKDFKDAAVWDDANTWLQQRR